MTFTSRIVRFSGKERRICPILIFIPVVSLAYSVASRTAKFWKGGIYKRIEIKMTNTIGIRHMIPIRFIQRLICSYCVFSL